MGRYCSYLLPKEDGVTSQIKVNKTKVRHQMCHPVQRTSVTVAPVTVTIGYSDSSDRAGSVQVGSGICIAMTAFWRSADACSRHGVKQ